MHNLLFPLLILISPPSLPHHPVPIKAVHHVVRKAMPIEPDAVYSARLAAQLCEAKPWVFCDPRIYR